MGYYIENIGTTFKEKIENLKSKHNATLLPNINNNIKFQPNLVCVVDNGFFAAAGYVFDESEFQAFNHPSDNRPKEWLIVPNADILSGYKK